MTPVPPRRRIAPLALALAIVLAAPSARAQPSFEWPSHPKNLKVLSKSTTPDQLRDTMVGFTRGLGIRCPYCHVGEEGKPLTTFDFASDSKPTKQIARGMMRMLDDVQRDLGRMKLSDAPRVTVRCATCHHGRPRPVTLAEELMVRYDKSGLDSTVAAYQDLRTRYYGRDAYDFSESGLADFAAALARKGHTEDAIRVHKLNVEQYPQSARALEGLAQGYEAAGQKDLAAETYRKVLAIEPENRNARRRLDELQGAPH